MSKNYTYKDYTFDKTTVRYVILNESKNVFMLLIPNSRIGEINDTYESINVGEEFPYNKDFAGGTLCHLHLSHHFRSPLSGSFKFSESFYKLAFKSQEVLKEGNSTTVETVVE